MSELLTEGPSVKRCSCGNLDNVDTITGDDIFEESYF